MFLRASFEQWVNALKTIIKDRSEAFQSKLFHDNAVAFYICDDVLQAVFVMIEPAISCWIDPYRLILMQ